ncbi:UNVERIFIED_CONTAM: hypothetical protein K2H54_023896 [Gekko kuhli]
MDLGIPNPLWCIYRTPVEEFEDEETPEEQENEPLNESMGVGNTVPNSQLDEDFIQAFGNLQICNPVDVNLCCVIVFLYPHYLV